MADRFLPLNQTNRNWRQVAVAPNGNVYAVVYNGDIYMQTGGAGNFNPLGQAVRLWWGIVADFNGDVYASANNDAVYKQTGGVGNFNLLRAFGVPSTDMAILPNGNIYIAVGFGGDIYLVNKGGGPFTAQGWPVAAWYGLTGAPNGDLYAAATGGDIYQRIGNVGAPVAMGAPGLSWYGMAETPDGDIYAAAQNWDIYLRVKGIGAFTAIGETHRVWAGMGSGKDAIYATVVNGDIYKYTLPRINKLYLGSKPKMRMR